MGVKIFFCYAHEDEALLNKLKTHLRPLQRRGLIDLWYDRDISAGTEWEREISNHLNTAQIILLLISPDFMNSDYCYGIEMQRAIERHERNDANVIPIILRHALWQEEPLSKLQALPKDAKPVKSWNDLDEALNDAAEGIRKVAMEIMTNYTSTISPSYDHPPVDEQVSCWMQAKASKSLKTKMSYELHMKSFRAVLHKHDLDLDSEDALQISSLLQDWASQAVRRSTILPNTYNQRIFIMQSFYKFALKQHWMKINPIAMVEIRKAQIINVPLPLDSEKVKHALKKIHRFTIEGKRDYALLCILLTTGLHASEIAGLRCGDVTRTASGVTITYIQKYGEVAHQPLLKWTAQALLDYFTAVYNNEYDVNDPIWLSYAKNGSRGKPISTQAISDICQKRLGATKVETTRRTYFAIKDVVGVTGIEEKLGINVVSSTEQPQMFL